MTEWVIPYFVCLTVFCLLAGGLVWVFIRSPRRTWNDMPRIRLIQDIPARGGVVCTAPVSVFLAGDTLLYCRCVIGLQFVKPPDGFIPTVKIFTAKRHSVAYTMEHDGHDVRLVFDKPILPGDKYIQVTLFLGNVRRVSNQWVFAHPKVFENSATRQALPLALAKRMQGLYHTGD